MPSSATSVPDSTAAVGGLQAQKGYLQLLFELSGGYRMPRYVLLVLLAIRFGQQLSLGLIVAAASSDSRWLGSIARWGSFLSFARTDVMHGASVYFGALIASFVWQAALLGGCLLLYLWIVR